MNTSRTIALLVAFLPLTAVAEERAEVDESSGPVAALKSSLPSTIGFEVDNVVTTDAGVACIFYRVANDNGGESKAQAVVEGDKVLRSSSRSTQFAKAWNSKCARSGSGAG